MLFRRWNTISILWGEIIMITNKSITYYHKTLDDNTKIEQWSRTIFTSAWVYETISANVDKGYDNSNKVGIRIPMKFVKNINIFSIGDIVAIGIQNDITKQNDLAGKEFYNITSININNFGNNPHIHLKGR